MDKEYLRKYRRMVNEYISATPYSVDEDAMPAGPEDPAAGGAMPADQAAGGAMPADPAAGAVMPADPAAGGAMPADPAAGGAMSADPAAGGAMPADPAAGGAMPATEPEPTEVEGFTPGEESNDTDDSEKEDEPKDDGVGEEELKHSQKHIEDKIEHLTSKFDRLMGKLDTFQQRISDIDNEIKSAKAEMEKRNPTPVEKMTMRSVKSGPFQETPEEYWRTKEETSNYSAEDDKNGEDMPEYKITQSDIDNVRDWSRISKSFDEERHDLKSILGY